MTFHGSKSCIYMEIEDNGFGKLVHGHRVDDDEEAFDEWIHKNRNQKKVSS